MGAPQRGIPVVMAVTAFTAVALIISQNSNARTVLRTLVKNVFIQIITSVTAGFTSEDIFEQLSRS